jgi:SAM-dependent methyltransferase
MEPTDPITFYDQHPFDWVPPDPRESIHAVVSHPLADLIESIDAKSLVLDIGCGPGRALSLLARRGIRCFGLDRSRISVGLAVERYHRPGVVGDNLRLPFADETADVVISDGVIHHTEDPRAAFYENCRVLKSGGRMYLAVYKPFGRYPWLYKYPGAVIRLGLSRRWTSPLVTVFAQGPYFLAHLFRSKGQRTWAGARNLFYDYFVTPRVAFLPRAVIEEWCASYGACVVRYHENRGANVHSFLMQKEMRPKVKRDPAMSSTVELGIAQGQGTT